MFELEIPRGSRNFLASTQRLYGDMPTVMRIGMHKSHVEDYDFVPPLMYLYAPIQLKVVYLRADICSMILVAAVDSNVKSMLRTRPPPDRSNNHHIPTASAPIVNTSSM